MFRCLVAVACSLSLGACGDTVARNSDSPVVRKAQVKVVGGSESAFLAQYGEVWTKQAPGLYTLADAAGKYQVAFGAEGATAALRLAQNDQAEIVTSLEEHDEASLRTSEQAIKAVSFWQHLVDSHAGTPAESDTPGLTASKVLGDCTVVATATVSPYVSCYAAATAEYNGIVGPPPWGAVFADAGLSSNRVYGSRVSVDAFDTSGGCFSSFAAASICGISVAVKAP